MARGLLPPGAPVPAGLRVALLRAVWQSDLRTRVSALVGGGGVAGRAGALQILAFAPWSALRSPAACAVATASRSLVCATVLVGSCCAWECVLHAVRPVRHLMVVQITREATCRRTPGNGVMHGLSHPALPEIAATLQLTVVCTCGELLQTFCSANEWCCAVHITRAGSESRLGACHTTILLTSL